MYLNYQNRNYSHQRNSYLYSFSPINSYKRVRFHYTPIKNQQNNFYNEITDIKYQNPFNYIPSHYESLYKSSNDVFNNKVSNIINEPDYKKNLFDNNYRYNISDTQYSNINNITNNYENRYKNNYSEHTFSNESNNNQMNNIYGINTDYKINYTKELYKNGYNLNNNNYIFKRNESYDFKINDKYGVRELNDERIKRQINHDIRNKDNLDSKGQNMNKKEINNYNQHHFRNNNDVLSPNKKEYLSYDNYSNNKNLKENNRFNSNNELNKPTKKDERYNILTRSKSNHSVRYSFIDFSDKKYDIFKSNFIKEDNINDNSEINKVSPDPAKYKISNIEKNDNNYLAKKEPKQINNQTYNDYRKNSIINNNNSYKPHLMPNNKYHNKRNSLYSNNHILMESIQNSYQNINGNENNFHINDLNKVDEKQEINCEKNNDINNKIEKPFVVEELRKREEINNKYKNIEKNEINTKNINNKNNNNKYHVKVILQKKDENKNNKHKISEDYKKHIIYYQKNDNISIVNSINNSSKKEKENNQKNELSNKYQKPYIRSASDPKFNQSNKSNYNERLNKNHNIKYDYKSGQQENKVNNYINSHNDNNKKIENQYKKELLDKNKSQYNFTNTPQGRYNSVNKYNNDNKLINQNPSINKDKENNIIYQNRKSKIKISTANKYIINNSSNNNLINRRKITDEKNPSLKRNSTYTKYIYNAHNSVSTKKIEPIIQQNKTSNALQNNYVQNNNINNNLNNHQLMNNINRNNNSVGNNFNDGKAKSPERIKSHNSRNQELNNNKVNNIQINNHNQHKKINNFISNNKPSFNQNNFIHQINNNHNDKHINNIDFIRNRTNNINQFNHSQNNNNNHIYNNFNGLQNNNGKTINKYISVNNNNISSNRFQNGNNNNIKIDTKNYIRNFSPPISPNNNINKFKDNEKNYISNNQNNTNIVKHNQLSNKNKMSKNNSSPDLRRNKRITKKHANGLQDVSATSYMNATLQCLAHIEKLTKYLLGKRYEIKTKHYNYKLSDAYLEVLENLWENESIKDYGAYDFKEIITKMNPIFEGKQENDSKDLIIFLLDNMLKELNRVKTSHDNNKDKVDEYNFYGSLNAFIKYFKKNFQSVVSDIFYGICDSQIKCLNCQIIKHNIQYYNILTIPLEEVHKSLNRNQNNVTLSECFEYYKNFNYKTEENQIFCNRCNQMTDSANSTSLIVGPKVLIINLNREKQLQLDIKINLDEYIDISPFIYYKNTPGKYQLIGVVTNLGSSGISEHFIAFCKSFVDKNWYKYDDSFVSLSSLQEAKNIGIPYILFYSIVE